MSKKPARSPPHMPRGPQQDRRGAPPEVAVAFANQGLLQLTRLDKVAVQRIIQLLQFIQRGTDEAVLVDELALHAQQTLSRAQTGVQFVRANGFD